MSNATQPGAGGTTIAIPFNSSQFASLDSTSADTALTLLAQPSIPGVGALFTVVGFDGTGTVSSPPLLGELEITGSTSYNFGLLPTGFLSIVNDASAQQVMLNAMTQNTTITSGTGGIVYANLSANNTVFLAGGVNLIAEELPGTSSIIYSDSASDNYVANNTGGNNQLTAVQAFSGSASVIASGGSAIQFYAGTGSNTVSVGAGTNFVEVSNANTVAGTTTAVTVTATSGELDFSAAGAPAVINAAASNVVFVTGGSGSVTLFGGTGSDTLSAGPSGVFQAGSGGNSVLDTSYTPSVAAATTLIGGASGDQLIANAGGAVLEAGGGAETLYTGSGTVGGVTFQVGSASVSANDTIFGSTTGGDTVGLNTGTADINFEFGNANTVSITAGGGSDTINFFRPGTDVFLLGAATVSSDVYSTGSGNTVVSLSDGTNVTFVTFVGVNMQTGNFTS